MNRGDVILARFPHPSGLRGKKRPAVVVQSDLYAERVGTLVVAEVLRMTLQDAQAVYRDLSGFKITLTPGPDGWHVDYDLTNPLSAGGGPHYVIHPDTGDILSRRYEQ